MCVKRTICNWESSPFPRWLTDHTFTTPAFSLVSQSFPGAPTNQRPAALIGRWPLGGLRPFIKRATRGGRPHSSRAFVHSLLRTSSSHLCRARYSSVTASRHAVIHYSTVLLPPPSERRPFTRRAPRPLPPRAPLRIGRQTLSRSGRNWDARVHSSRRLCHIYIYTYTLTPSIQSDIYLYTRQLGRRTHRENAPSGNHGLHIVIFLTYRETWRGDLPGSAPLRPLATTLRVDH